MQYRFVEKRDCSNEFTIAIEKKVLTIVLYKLITVNVQTLIDKKIIKLLNVAYIRNFMINIVFKSVLKKKVYFNIQHRHIHQNKKAIIFVFKIKNHYVIKIIFRTLQIYLLQRFVQSWNSKLFINNINLLLILTIKLLNILSKLLKKWILLTLILTTMQFSKLTNIKYIL